MTRTSIWLALFSLVAAGCAQTTGSAQSSTQASGTAGTKAGAASAGAQSSQDVQAVLTKSVDAKKAKEGDVVEAKTVSATKTSDNVSLPKGTKLVGHVTQAKARAKGSDDSKLGVLFDKAVLKDGKEIPFHALVVGAMAPQPIAVNADSGMSADTSAGVDAGRPRGESPVAGIGGGAVNTVGNTAGALGSTANQTVGNVAGSTVGAQTNTAANLGATGVALRGITVDAQASNNTNGTVFQSNQQNVKLESGTTVVLRATRQ
jgi:hypothetical protein